MVSLYLLYSHLQHHNNTIIKQTQGQRRKKKGRRNEGRRNEGRREDFFNNILPLTLFVRFACERVLETEHKLHILTPLLWPSRCDFLVLLMLGSTPSGLSEGALGRVWSSLPHLVSTIWKSAGNCIGGFRGPPRSGVAFPTTSRL